MPARIVLGAPVPRPPPRVQLPGAGDLVRALVREVIEEGRRFAETPEGRRAAAELVGSRLHKNGKVLWTIAGADELLSGEAAPGTGPVAAGPLLEALLGGAIEDFLMRFLDEYADHHHGGNGNGAAPDQPG